MKEIRITSQDASQRLDKYLKRLLPEMGTSFMYKMLRKKNITLNGKKATGSELLTDGDIVKCFFSDETFDKFSGKCNNVHSELTEEVTSYKEAFHSLQGIQVLYEDEHILLLDKPAGILSQKANSGDLSINEWMIGYLLSTKAINEDSLRHYKPSVCNRLDRNTSGIVICGKSLPGSREMSRMLKERTLQKYYRTYVYGHLEGEKVLEGYHKKNRDSNQADILFTKPHSNIEQYDPIITSYRSLMAKERYSYLEIELITGKTHQIRAHLAAYGHPIVGDRKYITSNSNCHFEADLKIIKYQLLHAYRIAFPTITGPLSYLSNKEFICKEPQMFENFNKHFELTN